MQVTITNKGDQRFLINQIYKRISWQEICQYQSRTRDFMMTLTEFQLVIGGHKHT